MNAHEQHTPSPAQFAAKARTSAPERISGVQAIVRSLEELGVEAAFGIPGGAVLPLHDPIYDSEKFHYVLVRHEQGVGHAVTGYVQVPGKVGVCIVTSNLGATNLVTPLADAQMDFIPVTAITGQVGRPLLGADAFQEADIRGVTMPITKHNLMVTGAKDIPRALAEALHLTSSGRPGPVLADVPKDLQNTMIDFTWPSGIALPGYRPVTTPHQCQIDEAAEMIAAAKHPVFYIGGGVIKADASKELAELTERTGVPVVATLMARGALPDSHPLHTGMPGIYGKVFVAAALQKFDLFITIGACFDDRVTGDLNSFVPNAKVIHADTDPAEIGKLREVDVPTVGDVREVLTALSEPYTKLGLDRLQITDWLKLLDGLRDEFPLGWEEPADGAIAPQLVIRTLFDIAGSEVIYAAGVGQHRMRATQFVQYENPCTRLNSGGASTMGYSIPAATGAKAAAPEKEVWAIDGDGCFQMTNQELVTCVMEGFPIKVALTNDGNPGMVRQWQTLFYDQRYSNTELRPGDNSYLPDLVQPSEGFSCVAIRVTKRENVAAAIKKAREISDRPVVIDFIAGEDARMWPMVAVGEPNDGVEYARGLRPLFNDENSVAETPTDIHSTAVDNAKDAVKQPDANHPSMKTC